jgi:hypothetical protein
MALSKLPQKLTDGIEYIDHRDSLYYNKYQYRARLYCTGINLCWYCKTPADVMERAKKNPQRFKEVDMSAISEFFIWRSNQDTSKNKTCTIRIENNTAAIFSNDLAHLKTLEAVGCKIDYTSVDNTIPQGTKYFTAKPNYQFRFYLKTKHVDSNFSKKLLAFITRYENTASKLVPSRSLTSWLQLNDNVRLGLNSWRSRYCSSHYYIDYSEESMLTLFTLMFDGMISKRFKLEKRPDTV